jgi:hypothetical protein
MPETTTTLTASVRPSEAARQPTKQQRKKTKKAAKVVTNPDKLLLAEYVTFEEAARQPNMPSERTLQRMAAERRLDGLVYLARKPLLHIPTFREGLKARQLKAVTERRGRK